MSAASGNRKPTGSIEIADSVILVRDGRDRSWQIRFDQVDRIRGWKDDVLTYDIVCLGLDDLSNDTGITIDEECTGWNEALQALNAEFPGFDKAWAQWWSATIARAFKTDLTTLWARVNGGGGFAS